MTHSRPRLSPPLRFVSVLYLLQLVLSSEKAILIENIITLTSFLLVNAMFQEKLDLSNLYGAYRRIRLLQGDLPNWQVME